MNATSSSGKHRPLNSANGVCLVALSSDSCVYPIEEGENLIGRWDPDAASFPEVDLTEVDPDVKVSRKHAIILRNGDTLQLKDIGSRNGTFLRDGSQLAPEVPHPLVDGEQFAVGKVHLRVKFG